jgi:hypothetical protein
VKPTAARRSPFASSASNRRRRRAAPRCVGANSVGRNASPCRPARAQRARSAGGRQREPLHAIRAATAAGRRRVGSLPSGEVVDDSAPARARSPTATGRRGAADRARRARAVRRRTVDAPPGPEACPRRRTRCTPPTSARARLLRRPTVGRQEPSPIQLAVSSSRRRTQSLAARPPRPARTPWRRSGCRWRAPLPRASRTPRRQPRPGAAGIALAVRLAPRQLEPPACSCGSMTSTPAPVGGDASPGRRWRSPTRPPARIARPDVRHRTGVGGRPSYCGVRSGFPGRACPAASTAVRRHAKRLPRACAAARGTRSGQRGRPPLAARRSTQSERPRPRGTQPSAVFSGRGCAACRVAGRHAGLAVRASTTSARCREALVTPTAPSG